MPQPVGSSYDDAARDGPTTPACVFARWLFLRLLGCIFLAAFLSAWTQIHGLIGSRGILPVAAYLERAEAAFGDDAYFRVPTLCWLDPSDEFLTALCAGGVALSGLLILGIAPAVALALFWADHLLLMVAGH